MGLSDETINQIILSEYGKVLSGEQKEREPGETIEIINEDGSTSILVMSINW